MREGRSQRGRRGGGGRSQVGVVSAERGKALRCRKNVVPWVCLGLSGADFVDSKAAMTDAYPIGCGASALEQVTSCSSAKTRMMACAHERWQIRPTRRKGVSAGTVGKQGGRRTKFILLRLYYCFSWFRVSSKHRRTALWTAEPLSCGPFHRKAGTV
jgi:hypothetical protein